MEPATDIAATTAIATATEEKVVGDIFLLFDLGKDIVTYVNEAGIETALESVHLIVDAFAAAIQSRDETILAQLEESLPTPPRHSLQIIYDSMKQRGESEHFWKACDGVVRMSQYLRSMNPAQLSTYLTQVKMVIGLLTGMAKGATTPSQMKQGMGPLIAMVMQNMAMSQQQQQQPPHPHQHMPPQYLPPHQQYMPR